MTAPDAVRPERSEMAMMGRLIARCQDVEMYLGIQPVILASKGFALGLTCFYGYDIVRVDGLEAPMVGVRP